MTSSLLEPALDISFAGGYPGVGDRIRGQGWNPLPRMEGDEMVVTRATSSLGLVAADGFARLRASVWLAVRNRERSAVARGLGVLTEVLGCPAHRTVNVAA